MSLKNTKKNEAAETKNPPVGKVRVGLITASIWENKTDKGVFHNVTFERRYKDGDQWKSSHSYNTSDLLSSPRRRTWRTPKSSKRRPRLNNRTRGGSIPGRRLNLNQRRSTMNRILQVTDEDETLVLEYVDLEYLRNEGSEHSPQSRLDTPGGGQEPAALQTPEKETNDYEAA